MHEGWRGSRCVYYRRVCACDGGDYCLPWTPATYCTRYGRTVQGGTAQLRLSGHRIQLAARPWRLAEGARGPLLGRDPRPLVAGALAVVRGFFLSSERLQVPRRAAISGRPRRRRRPRRHLNRLQVHRKWCADVVARIEAIESTIQVMQNPPPPRHDFLNMYSGEIGICVFYFVLSCFLVSAFIIMRIHVRYCRKDKNEWNMNPKTTHREQDCC